MYLDPTTVTIPSPLAAWQRELEERTTAGGHRTYRTPDGAWLPSVTSVLKATEIESPELAAWRERQSAHDLAEVEALRDEGCARGSVVHDLVEGSLVARQTPGASRAKPASPWWAWISPALRMVDHLHASELAVYHPGLGYAGRLDGLVSWCGTVAVSDWKTKRAKIDPKTGRPRRPKREWLLHHHEQIVAYVDALNAMGVTVGGEPVRAGVLVVAIEGSPKPVIHELGELELGQARERFHAKLDRYYLGAA
jgi:hypothetical protein